MARTIDNLGVDSSARYAEDQKKLDPSFVQELRKVPVKPQVDVTQAFFSSELDALLDMHQLAVPWAIFQAPEGYFEQNKGLFTARLIPTIGKEEKLTAEMLRLESAMQNMETAKKNEDVKGDDVMKWEEGREVDDEAKEKEALLNLLNCISRLDHLLTDINGRRNQYQKG